MKLNLGKNEKIENKTLDASPNVINAQTLIFYVPRVKRFFVIAVLVWVF